MMTDYECFCDWAWGHIEDVYRLTEEDGILGSLIDFIKDCAKCALSDFTPEEQYEHFGFTLDQVQHGVLLDQFCYQFVKESSVHALIKRGVLAGQ